MFIIWSIILIILSSVIFLSSSEEPTQQLNQKISNSQLIQSQPTYGGTTINIQSSINEQNPPIVIINGSSNSQAPIILQKGWDPTFSTRRITTQDPSQNTYYESCPDSPTGKCYGTIPAGGGFYSLRLQDGPMKQPCKVNSQQQYMTAKGIMEPCPYFFIWQSGGNGKPMTALLGYNNTNWTVDGSYNEYVGIEETNHYIPYYGSSLENEMHTNNGTTTVTLQAFHSLNQTANPNANARYAIGMAWYSSSMGKSFVIEFNVGGLSSTQGYEATWNPYDKIDYDGPDQGTSTTLFRVELGGVAWGYPDLTNSTVPITYTIHWDDVIAELVKEKNLPSSILNDDRPFFSEIGEEHHGRLYDALLVSNYHNYEISQNNSSNSSIINHVPSFQPSNQNNAIPEFGQLASLMLMIIIIFMIGITKIKHIKT